MSTRSDAHALIVGVMVCGGFAAWAAGASPWQESEIDHAVGISAIVAFVLAAWAVALLRLRWASIPLVVVCVFAIVTAKKALFDTPDPSDVSMFVYFAMSMGLVLTAGVGLILGVLQDRSGLE